MNYAKIPTKYIRMLMGGRESVLDEILKESLLDDRMPTIQIDDNAGHILQLLTTLHKPMNVLEIGTLFGYSAIYMARGLPVEGKITTVEIDEKAAAVATRNIYNAGFSHQVNVVCDDALVYIDSIENNSLDMVFIDADKKSYPSYLKQVYSKMRKGALIIADDAFAAGEYCANETAEENDKETHGIKTYNYAVVRSPHLFSAFIGTEHGLLASIKL